MHSASGESGWARLVGYLAAAIANGILLVIVNGRPGWRELSFLTEELVDILWLINLSWVASVVVNVVYLWFDPSWFKSACQVGVSAIGLAAAIRTLQVFPFDFSAYAFNWTALVRPLLWLTILGTFVTVVVELVHLAKSDLSTGVRSQAP